MANTDSLVLQQVAKFPGLANEQNHPLWSLSRVLNLSQDKGDSDPYLNSSYAL